MKINHKVKKSPRSFRYLGASLLALLGVSQSADASGLKTLQTNEQLILDTLQSAAPITITLAIIIAGYLFLFTEVQHKVIFRILVGGFLIGGAPLIAEMFH
ncbi:TrbC/VirB2 family protein [Photobacterium carnosum]|uniref:TrbC/VirB2 family protein n=1 Tax=Photobacterium carnosum TaxID=2023717 RepID=UPI001E59FC36|nr:TrbC/VirB2 family protein [Photobacterium carnosum]MCD9538975.1 hypothetical protein [Photobacterium carnosum]MCF2163671.1 hypothetical protein [Photobacterium carnosum]MCF2307915.1 hypothetical protein [Photobacterium carnosum]